MKLTSTNESKLALKSSMFTTIRKRLAIGTGHACDGFQRHKNDGL
jgi:hypothetical protein